MASSIWMPHICVAHNPIQAPKASCKETCVRCEAVVRSNCDKGVNKSSSSSGAKRAADAALLLEASTTGNSNQGRPSSKANDAFLPYFRFPPLFRIFQSLVKFSPLLENFPKTFSPKNYDDLLLAIPSQFVIFTPHPYFRKNRISALFRKLFLVSPILQNVSPHFVEFTCC